MIDVYVDDFIYRFINMTYFYSVLVNITNLTCGVPHVGAVCHNAGVLLYFGFDACYYM